MILRARQAGAQVFPSGKVSNIFAYSKEIFKLLQKKYFYKESL